MLLLCRKPPAISLAPGTLEDPGKISKSAVVEYPKQDQHLIEDAVSDMVSDCISHIRLT